MSVVLNGGGDFMQETGDDAGAAKAPRRGRNDSATQERLPSGGRVVGSAIVSKCLCRDLTHRPALPCVACSQETQRPFRIAGSVALSMH